MEKKSERLEVRVGFKEKKKFADACDSQGDTPSGAIRRFIRGYVRRADSDLLSSAWRNFWRRRSNLTAAGIAAILIVGLFFVLFIKSEKVLNEYGLGKSSSELKEALSKYPEQERIAPIGNDATDPGPKTEIETFNRWDANGDGNIQEGEILPNDKYLHKVLETDGKAGISLNEFWSKGRMIYQEAKVLETNIDERAVRIKHTDEGPARLVEFDLTGQRPHINVYLVTSDSTAHKPDRTVMRVAGKVKPTVNVSNYDYRQRNE